MPMQSTETIEEIEEAIYQELIAEVPDILPVVARSLARTTAERIRENRVINKSLAADCQTGHSETPDQFPDEQPKQNYENEQQQ